MIMGVHTLWDILADAAEENVKVTSLRDKRLAVDLSAWIVELRQSKASSELRNAYIRNLFFRTIYFMKEGVELVFVLDGRAPELKQKALLTRQQNQFGSSSNTANPDRPFLKNAVSQCVEMLGYLGLPWIQSDGEAEALCARLNSEGMLDGCLTEDNDFFLYGGKTLYRKLRKENKAYFVNKINMEKINDKLGLERRDLVALALLLGSDYDDQKGVKNVGKEKGMALVELLKSRNLDVLNRLLGWRENKELASIEEKLSTKVKHDAHCSKCEHLGRVSIHESSGCSMCQTERGCCVSCDSTCLCEWHELEALRKEHKLEISLRHKSLENTAFPNKEIVNEFLDTDALCCKSIPKPSMNLPNLMGFLRETLRWTCDEVTEKMFSVVILKQLRGSKEQTDLMFTPVRIVRSCKENHVECYEVAWDKTDKNDWAGSKFATVEVKVERGLFESVFPEMVANYEMSLTQKKPRRGRKRKLETGKGQLKLTDFTKIKKRLEFDEKVNIKTQENRHEHIAENSVVDLTEDDRNRNSVIAKSRNSSEKINSKSSPGISGVGTLMDLTVRDIDTKIEMEELADVKSKTELGHSQTKTHIKHCKSAEEVKEKNVSQNVKCKNKKGESVLKSDKRVRNKSTKKSLEVNSKASIQRFFLKKDVSVTKTVEFKQNDTKAFQVANSSTSFL